jgi:hypothetical protein
VKRQSQLLGFLMLFALISAAPAWGATPGPLPAFHLSALDGHAVQSSDLPSKGKWLILYVSPRSRATDRVLSLLNPGRNPNLTGKVVIIVAGSVDESRRLQSAYPNSSISWFADDGHAAAAALKLNGLPVLLGIKDSSVHWVLNGALQNGAIFGSVVNSWIKRSP